MTNPYTAIYNAVWESYILHPKNDNLRRMWDNVSMLWEEWEDSNV